jgi:hypothetical protein
MYASPTQDPMLMVLLGFILAMMLVVVVLLLTRPSRYPSPGYTQAPVIYASEQPASHPPAGCAVIPLLIVATVMLLAILS